MDIYIYIYIYINFLTYIYVFTFSYIYFNVGIKGALALSEFLGEGVYFFRGRPEDILKVIFNC